MLLQDDKHKNNGPYDSEGFRAALGAGLVRPATVGKPIKCAVTQDAKVRMVVYEGKVTLTSMVMSSRSLSACLLPPFVYQAVPTRHAQQHLQRVHFYCGLS